MSGQSSPAAARTLPPPQRAARLVLIDNYDSFTFNLVQRFGELDPTVKIAVFRNDQVTLEEIAALHPTHLVISPGPGTPDQAGISREAIHHFSPKLPVLGVCLGHQCIGQSFGGEVVRNYRQMHGKTSWIHHDGRGVFRNLPNPFEATRYHSLVIRRDSFHHPDFEITAWTDEDEIMGIRHRSWQLEGVQFHPESFLTSHGPQLLRNFLQVMADTSERSA